MMISEILDIMISNPIPLMLIMMVVVFALWRGTR